MTSGLSRRRFLRLSVGAVVALPGLAMAQTQGGARRAALLLTSTPAAASHLVNALVEGLAGLGWVEGRNLRLEVRYAEGDLWRLRPLATELPRTFLLQATQTID